MVSDFHVLVTGCTGYIGSHTVLSLLEEGYYVTIVDNLCNSDRRVLDRLSELAGERFSHLVFQEVDLCDAAATTAIFEKPQAGRKIDAVIHFAGHFLLSLVLPLVLLSFLFVLFSLSPVAFLVSGHNTRGEGYPFSV